MTDRQCREGHHQGGAAPKRHGSSSFWLHDPEQIFSHIRLREGMTFIDAGCGAGEYALHAAGIVGGKGRVFALEKQEGLIDGLIARAAQQGLTNMVGQACDITAPLPLEDGIADVILLSTVLHIGSVRERCGSMFQEFHRILRPGGCLAVINCKKQDASFGPPKHMRLSEEEVEAAVLPCGFDRSSELDLGHTYLLCFRRR